jgi:EspG family
VWDLADVEFDVLWRELGLGAPPYPIEVPSPGTTYEERAQIVEAVRGGLAARGIRPELGLTEALTLAATNEVLLDGHLVLDEHLRLLAARAGDRATMVLQRGPDLQVRAMPGPRLAAALTELLPPIPPAHGQSVRLPAEVLSGALRRLGEGGSIWELEDALRQAGIRGPDARWIAALAQGPARASAAQLGLVVRGPGGERRLGPLSWYATEDGGVVVQRQAGSDWVTIAPGDPARLVARLEDLAAAR